jgi:iron complex transport system substrate-binding protein
VAAVLAVGLAATACGGGTGSPDHADGSAGPGFPVRIRSALGTAAIPATPKRVVTIGWGSQDVALALGVVPVGMQDFTGDTGDTTGVLPWDQARLGGAKPVQIKATGTEVPYERVAALRPDVILAVNSGVTDAQYAKLSKIAPTVGYPGKPWMTSWEDQTRLVGRALGRTGRAAGLITTTKARIAKEAKRHPEFRGKTVAFGSGTEPGSVNFYYDADARVELLRQLGFTPAPSVSRLGAGGSRNSFAKQVSMEKLPGVRADVLVAWYLSPSVRTAVEGSPLFRKLRPVRDGAYVPLTDPGLVYATSAPSVLSLPWMMDRYVPKLSAAAGRAG